MQPMRGGAYYPLLLFILAGCPGSSQTGGGVGKPEPRCDRVGGPSVSGQAIASANDSTSDLYQAYLDTGEIARVRQVWELGGAGGVRRLIGGYIQFKGFRCSVLAAVVERGGKGAVVRVHGGDDRGELAFAGAYDLAGCERSVSPRPERAELDPFVTRQLQHMRQPAVALWEDDVLRFFHLSANGVSAVGELRPNYRISSGSYSAINGIDLVPGEGGMVARWEDIYHPAKQQGTRSSPVGQLQEGTIRLPEPATTGTAPPPPLEATRARVAADLGVDSAAVDALQIAFAPFADNDGWLVVDFARGAQRHVALGLLTVLYCGGFAVDHLIDLGAATGLEWASPVGFGQPMALDIGDAKHAIPFVPPGDVLSGRAARDRHALERADKERQAHVGLAVVTRGAGESRTLHLISDRHGVIWQAKDTLPARIELVHGTADLPYLLASGRVYRFDGTRYQLDDAAPAPAR